MRQIVLLALLSSPLFGLPQGAISVSGDAQLQLSSPETLEILASDRAVIEWSDFSLEAEETVRFLQPHAAASVFNRVLDAYPSRLMGRLEANGQVLLINPNGILVGRDAQIDTGSFIASTLDLQIDTDLSFTGDSMASVINHGSIRAREGDICLVGARVENHGSMEAQDGIAGLFAAQETVLKPKGQERVFIKVREWNDSDNFFAQAFIPYEQAGYAVQAGSIVSRNSDQTGGWVGLFGGIIEVQSDSLIDVSAPEGGGIVLLGGDFKGKNPHLENARFNWVAPSAQILANATSSGNGGKVIVWSDEKTICYGSIEAMGGPVQGDGGLVEVSGDFLDFQGTVSTLAPGGKTGSLYLDPLDLTVANVAANTNVTLASPFMPNGGAVCIDYGTAPPTQGSSVLRRTTLLAALAANDVVIDTTCGTGVCPSGACAGGCPGDILFLPSARFANDLGGVPLWTSPHSLTLTAFHDIVILCHVLNNNTGNITLQANHQIRINDHNLQSGGSATPASVGTLLGTIRVNAPCADLILQGSNNTNNLSWAQLGYPMSIDFNPASITATAPIFVDCANILLEAGQFTTSPAQIGHGCPTSIRPAAGNVNANITVSAQGSITFRNQAAVITSTSNYNKIGHGGPNFGAALAMAGNISVSCTGALTLEFLNNGCIPGIPPACVIGPPTTCCATFINTIGHGTAPTLSTATGNIAVLADGDIYLGYHTPNPAGSTNQIGHDSSTTIVGDITVRTCGNLTLDTIECTGTGVATNLIGISGGSTVSANTNITVIAGQTITLNSGSALTVTNTSVNMIGEVGLVGGGTLGGNPATTPFTGNVTVAAGNSLLINYNSTLSAGNAIGIGVLNSNAASVSNTYVAAGMDISITNFNSGVANSAAGCGILGVNDINVAAGNDILLTANTSNNSNLNTYAFIGPAQYTTATPSTTRVFASRDIICANNGSSPDRATLARSNVTPAGAVNVSLIARAGGDVQLASNIFAPPDPATTGSILIEADSTFPAGGLYFTAGGAIATIAGQPVAPAATIPNCVPALNFNSNPTAADGLGAIRVNKGAAIPAAALTIQTTTGNLSIHSAPRTRSNAVQNLTLSNAANINNLNLVTVNGSIDVSGSICTDGFATLTITGPITTTGSICLRSNTALAINFPVTATGAGSSLSLVSVTGDLNLAANVSTLGGPLLLSAGYPLTANCCAAPASCCCNAISCCCIPAACGTATANVASITQTAGAITTTDSGGNIGTIQLQAATNITLGGAATGASSQTGAIQMCANNQVAINRAISSTAGPITLVADADDSGSGNLTITANITSLSGNISLRAGAVAGCFAAFHSSSINHTAGTVNPGTGNISANAAFDINLSSPAVPSWLVSTGSIHTLAGHDTNLTGTTLQKTGAGVTAATDVLMISGHNMTLVNSHIAAVPSFVTLVVDNCFPVSPLIGPGAFNLDAASSIDPVNLRIFTALQGLNLINGALNLNGATFVKGQLYVNTATEHWCQYFGFPFPYPFSNLGSPFTIFYKDCLQQTTNQAQVIVTEFLLDLHPYNEFPGWMEEYWIQYQTPKNTPLFSSSLSGLGKEPYFLRRRHLNVINHPKTWTQTFY